MTASGTFTVEYIAETTDFEMYDTLFDDFHYDIGHGAGTGSGQVNTAPVQDGFGAGYGAPRGSFGDSQT